MTRSDTLLRRLHEQKETASSVADELNLYYVALTRAKYSLHAVFKEATALPDVRYARSFADFTDFSVWEKYLVRDEEFELEKQERTALVFRPDEELARSIMDAFLWKYPHAGGENLPVKSSATKLMQGRSAAATAATETIGADEEGIFDEPKRFDGGTGREAGVAYHAFLELFDFTKLYDQEGAPLTGERLKTLVAEEVTALSDEIENAKLLSVDKLTEILSNEAFYALKGKRLYKERKFLAVLPVREVFPELGEVDGDTIFQGAIDLMAVGDDGVRIVDYKYSHKNADELKAHYAPQLALYRAATAKILRIPPENIRCSIVNIYRGFEVEMD